MSHLVLRVQRTPAVSGERGSPDARHDRSGSGSRPDPDHDHRASPGHRHHDRNPLPRGLRGREGASDRVRPESGAIDRGRSAVRRRPQFGSPWGLGCGHPATDQGCTSGVRGFRGDRRVHDGEEGRRLHRFRARAPASARRAPGARALRLGTRRTHEEGPVGAVGHGRGSRLPGGDGARRL